MGKGQSIYKIFVVLITLFLNLYAYSKGKNIVIISVDTLRADHLSAYGYPMKTSPNIDKFSEDGILFKRCFALTPLTAPSFSTLLTSLPPYIHGAKRNGLSIYNNIKTLPFYLKSLNYYSVAFISNWPLRKRLSHLHKYFNKYRGIFTKKRWLGLMQPEGKAEDITKASINWLKKNKDKRFFIWIHYTEPHAPYIMHKGFSYNYSKTDKKTYPPMSNMKKIKKYDSEIGYTDSYIGKLFDFLKQEKLYKESLIIFNSDHGESFGEHSYYKHGRRLYNSTINVPLIIKLPNNDRGGRISNKIISLMDVSPTILSLLGEKIPKEMKGHSVFSRAENHRLYFETYRGAVILKKSLKGQIKVKPTYFSIVEYPYKLIARVNFKNLRFKRIEAYNIEDDFFETHNIWNYKSENLMMMSKDLKKRILKIKKYIRYSKKHLIQNSKISKRDMEKLKSLGYIQ